MVDEFMRHWEDNDNLEEKGYKINLINKRRFQYEIINENSKSEIYRGLTVLFFCGLILLLFFLFFIKPSIDSL